MRLKPLGGLGVVVEHEGHRLYVDFPGGEGKVLLTGSPPLFGEPEPEGSWGPFSWEAVELEGARGKVYGYLIKAGGKVIFHAGGARKPFEPPEADALLLPAGGAWYMDALDACKVARRSEASFVPLATWRPGIRRPFEGIEVVRDLCRGTRRLRARGWWEVERGWLVLFD